MQTSSFGWTRRSQGIRKSSTFAVDQQVWSPLLRNNGNGAAVNGIVQPAGIANTVRRHRLFQKGNRFGYEKN